MRCVNNPLLGWAKGCKCPNVDLQNNLKAWTICGHSLYKEKGKASFSTSKMMSGNFSFVCSHGHWGPVSNGCHFNNGNNPILSFHQKFWWIGQIGVIIVAQNLFFLLEGFYNLGFHSIIVLQFQVLQVLPQKFHFYETLHFVLPINYRCPSIQLLLPNIWNMFCPFNPTTHLQ